MARSRKQDTFNLREGRVYLHKNCGQYTGVTEEHFEGLCNPLSPCLGTWCSTCNSHDKLRNFCWADTKERLDKYRRRIKKTISPGLRIFIAILPLLGALLGFLVTYFFMEGASVVAVVTVTLLGALVGYIVVVPLLFRFVIRTKFYKTP